MSEGLLAQSAADNDWRGDIHNDDGIFRFHTINPPNSTVFDVISRSVPGNNPDDPIAWVTQGNAGENAARSRHPGGVNASRCDGSVSYVTSTVSQTAWSAAGTMNGGEVNSDVF